MRSCREVLLLALLLQLAACQPQRPQTAFGEGPDVAGSQRPMYDAVLAHLTPEQRALVERSTRGPEAAIEEQRQQVEKELKAQASRQFNKEHRKHAAEAAVGAAAATAAPVEGFDQAAYNVEHAALLAIKDGASGSVFSSWADNTSHCTEWGDSVACNEAGRVTKLSLFLSGFDGPLNEHLEVLSKLQFLELTDEDSTEETQLPATWPAAFPEMSFLDVRFFVGGGYSYYGSDDEPLVALPGPIPSTWGDWKALQHLILGGIAGTIPRSLAKLSSLQTLSLSSNELTGAVPDLSGMTSLVTLSLAFNQLSGTVTGLDRLANLTNLYLSSNNFSGDLPALPSSIVEAILSLCDFTGGLPSSYASLVKLKKLELDSNPRLGGVVPASYSSLTSLESFSASNCGLTGIEPGLVLPNAALVWLSSNSIETLPTNFEGWSRLAVLDVGDNKIGGPLPTGFPPRMYWFIARNNQLSGRLPASPGNLSSAVWIDLSSNQLTGPLPDWKAWKLGQYAILDLSRNCLSSDKAIPCLEPSRLPTRLSICFNPVSPEICGANAGTLSGCVPPQVGGNNPEFGDYGTLFCDYGGDSWREGTGLAYCGIESYSRAETNSTCVQQLNSPLDPACSSDRNATAAQPWGFFNQGSSSGVMRVPVEGKVWWEIVQGVNVSSWCSISRGVGYASASCSVNSRGQERITFNLTTANADNITKRLYWTGCQPLKAPADAAGPAQTTTRSCNKWAAVPINAKKVRLSPAYTSTTWTVNLPKRSCSCEQVYWSLFAKSDTVCGADGP